MINISSLEEDIRVVDGLLVELRRRKIIDENISGIEFVDLNEGKPPLQTEEIDYSESGTSDYEIGETLDNDNSSAVNDTTQDDSLVESETDNRCMHIYEKKSIEVDRR